MKCSVDGCEDNAKHKGLCGKHYKRQWRHGSVEHCEVERQKGFICGVEDCNKESRTHGLCKIHYQRFYRYGRLENIYNARGARVVNNAGYIILTVNGRRVYEHIYLAELALGKLLPKGAIVHHMNEKPWDNYTPFNLIVCPDQAYHLLLHRRMKEFGYANNSDS